MLWNKEKAESYTQFHVKNALTGLCAKFIIENISKMKVTTTPGISNKCIFKHMDLLDELS